MSIFGEPNKGIHKHRLFGIAIVDLAMTIIVAYLVAYMFKFKYSFAQILGALLITGIGFHRYFNVKTTIDKLLFGSKN